MSSISILGLGTYARAIGTRGSKLITPSRSSEI